MTKLNQTSQGEPIQILSWAYILTHTNTHLCRAGLFCCWLVLFHIKQDDIISHLYPVFSLITMYLNRVGVGRTYLNIAKVMDEEPTADTILHGEMLKFFPLISEIKWGCPVSNFYSTLVIEILASAIR